MSKRLCFALARTTQTLLLMSWVLEGLTSVGWASERDSNAHELRRSRLLQIASKSGILFSDETIQTQDHENKSHFFTRIESGIPSKMGESWIDQESGLIWGDFLKTESGEIDLMNRKSAQRRCEAIGARLPSDLETYRFLKNLGYAWNGSTSSVPDDLIPNLNHEHLESELEDLIFPILWFTLVNYQDIRGTLQAKDPLFWTSTVVRSYNYEYGKFCNSQTGRVLRETMKFRGAGARCVISAEENDRILN